MTVKVVHTSFTHPRIIYFSNVPDPMTEQVIIDKFKNIFNFDPDGEFVVSFESELPLYSEFAIVNWEKS